MGQFATALANLAAVAVSGVTSYAVEATPDALTGAQLPALIILPEVGGESPGFAPSTLAAGIGTLSVRVTHLLLIAPVAVGLGLRGALPAVIDAVDAYTEALADDPTLGGALAMALHVSVQVGVMRYAGVDYHGAAFTHTWALRVG
jgi:hypothetical protein